MFTVSKLMSLRVVPTIDFLAVRKIPLTERPFLMDGSSSSREPNMDGEGERPEDFMVEQNTTKIRAVLLRDRDHHDKVRPFT